MQGILIFLMKITFVFTSNSTFERERETFSEFLISYLYHNYPKFLETIQREFYSPKVLSEQRNTAYKGYLFEMKRKTDYEILLGDAYQQSFRSNGSFQSEGNPSTVLYQCKRPIRYCSGDARYCELREGDFDSNLILVVPHGGTLQPEQIPDRDAGCFINNKCFYDHRCEDKKLSVVKNFTVCGVERNVDVYTKEIALILANNIEDLTGKRPHIILNNLHRKKLDVNRNIERATFNVLEAEKAWTDFHGLIDQAKSLLPNQRGLLVDIHGSSHAKKWNMLGYGLTPTELLRGAIYPFLTTIRSLGESRDIPFKELITGNSSLAYFMMKNGIPVMPSFEIEHPGNETYYSGGYIIHRHGSMFYGQVDAIQMEINKEYRHPETAELFCKGFAKSLVEFIKTNYFLKKSEISMDTKNKTRSTDITPSFTIKSSNTIYQTTSIISQGKITPSPNNLRNPTSIIITPTSSMAGSKMATTESKKDSLINDLVNSQTIFPTKSKDHHATGTS